MASIFLNHARFLQKTRGLHNFLQALRQFQPCLGCFLLKLSCPFRQIDYYPPKEGGLDAAWKLSFWRGNGEWELEAAKNSTGWWFPKVFLFSHLFGEMMPFWLIVFKLVETTNWFNVFIFFGGGREVSIRSIKNLLACLVYRNLNQWRGEVVGIVEMSLQKLRKIARQLGFTTHLKMGYISIMYIFVYTRGY